MKTSSDRILTTHVGSLPRPQDVVDLLFAQDRGEPESAVLERYPVQSETRSKTKWAHPANISENKILNT